MRTSLFALALVAGLGLVACDKTTKTTETQTTETTVAPGAAAPAASETKTTTDVKTN